MVHRNYRQQDPAHDALTHRMAVIRAITFGAACVLALATQASGAASGGAPAPPAQPKTEIMIVGVAHLVARNDIHNSAFTNDPLSPGRQAQIADVVSRLARFHPTKVLIEASMSNPVYKTRYEDYVRGTYALGANEIYQFGFRLAKLAGNAEIYPIDTPGPTIVDEKSSSGKVIGAFLSANLPNVSDPITDASIKREDELERSGTYLELLRYLNTDEAIRANASWYSIVDGIGRSANGAGAAYVAEWYARNCYIFANISSVISPGDRAAVLIGQGHEYLLREFVRLNPDLIDVDPLQYLMGQRPE